MMGEILLQREAFGVVGVLLNFGSPEGLQWQRKIL